MIAHDVQVIATGFTTWLLDRGGRRLFLIVSLEEECFHLYPRHLKWVVKNKRVLSLCRFLVLEWLLVFSLLPLHFIWRFISLYIYFGNFLSRTGWYFYFVLLLFNIDLDRHDCILHFAIFFTLSVGCRELLQKILNSTLYLACSHWLDLWYVSVCGKWILTVLYST